MKRVQILGVVAMVALSTVAHAGQGVWTTGGAGAEWATSLAVDPTNPATVYGAAMDMIYKSTNSGGTWSLLAPTRGFYVYYAGLTVDPTNPATIYAGRKDGVFKSTDAGATWTLSDRGITNSGITSLALHPSNRSILYAGAYGATAVFKSTDSGSTWAAATTWRPPSSQSGLAVQAVVIDPSNPSILYAGATSGVYKSIDSGSTWNPASEGLTNLDVGSLILDPKTPSTLYAATYDGGVFKTTDSAATWVPANTGLTNLQLTALVVDPSHPSTLYAGTHAGGIFRSLDAGETWVAINAGLPDLLVLSLALDPTGLTTLYAGLRSGVWQMTFLPGVATLIPTSARLAGANGAFFTTNVSVSNTGSAAASFTMKFLGHDRDGSDGPEQTFNLDAGKSVTYFDVLSSVFDLSSGFGAIRVTADSTALRIVSVTSTPGFGGTLSQTVPAIPASNLIGAGSSRSILYIREGDGFRSNLILASIAGVPTTVDAVLVSPSGAPLAAKSYSVPPNGMTQIFRFVRDMGVSGALTGARLVLSSSTPDAAFAALATVIDEVSNDPTAIVATEK